MIESWREREGERERERERDPYREREREMCVLYRRGVKVEVKK